MSFTTREDREDGLDLRGIRHADEEVVSRLYFALRDPWWRTVPMRILARERTVSDEGFTLDVVAESASAAMPLDVRIRYRAKGAELTAEVDAVARAAFDYNRVGWCALLSGERYGGRPVTATRGGERSSFAFPEAIVIRGDPTADAFHARFDSVATELASGTLLEIAASGTELELEDQRNWSDATFKAYAAAERPWPLRAQVGERFVQQLTLRVVPGAVPAADVEAQVRVGPALGPLCRVAVYRGQVSPRALRPAGGFADLNLERRGGSRGGFDATAYDSVELAVNGAVHAADDDSVTETAAVHGAIVRRTRELVPGLPVRLAPVAYTGTAGDWRDTAGGYLPEPPDEVAPSRWAEPQAATWLVASVASAAPELPDALHYFGPGLPAGSPAALAAERFARLAGRELLTATVPAPLAAVAVRDGDDVVLALANAGPDPRAVWLPDGRRVVVDGFGSGWWTVRPGRLGA